MTEILYGFQSEEISCKTRDGRHITLTQPLVFISKDGTKYTVPKGFKSDGASFFKPWGKYWKSAVLHDCLYTRKDLEKHVADSLFREAMEDDGVPWLVRSVLWEAVHSFGRKAWDEDQS